MNTQYTFKSSFAGFKRTDVILYIEKLSNDFYEYRQASEATAQKLRERIEFLEAKIEEMGAELENRGSARNPEDRDEELAAKLGSFFEKFNRLKAGEPVEDTAMSSAGTSVKSEPGFADTQPAQPSSAGADFLGDDIFGGIFDDADDEPASSAFTEPDFDNGDEKAEVFLEPEIVIEPETEPQPEENESGSQIAEEEKDDAESSDIDDTEDDSDGFMLDFGGFSVEESDNDDDDDGDDGEDTEPKPSVQPDAPSGEKSGEGDLLDNFDEQFIDQLKKILSEY